MNRVQIYLFLPTVEEQSANFHSYSRKSGFTNPTLAHEPAWQTLLLGVTVLEIDPTSGLRISALINNSQCGDCNCVFVLQMFLKTEAACNSPDAETFPLRRPGVPFVRSCFFLKLDQRDVCRRCCLLIFSPAGFCSFLDFFVYFSAFQCCLCDVNQPLWCMNIFCHASFTLFLQINDNVSQH